ncbi:MAG: hypothetical protein K5912_00345 [Alphaproteobacteria bacterium]|nr:hypothetical protein [Alphaproteobacteria bacterium]
MNRLKKFFIVFFSFFPLTAGAIVPWLVVGGGLGIGALGIAGYSTYRTLAPVNMSEALQFFSSCWTCNMFSSIMSSLSNILPGIFSGIGKIVIPMSVVLMLVYFTVTLTSNYLNLKVDKPWDTVSNFGQRIIKLILVIGLLAIPLPRLISELFIEPVFNVGLSVNHLIGDSEKFNECVVATSLMDNNLDRVSIATAESGHGAFSTKLRSGLACELAEIHQITGLGMTVGWTMLNMAFDEEYMHHVMWDIPIFPNVPIILAGLLVLVVYFFALLPIPMYFLEIFVTLAMDFVMLPLMLLSWLFKDWKILPQGQRTIETMINDVIKGVVGLAMTGIFLIFGTMFLEQVFGNTQGMSNLQKAIARNDSKVLMDGLLLQDEGLLNIVLMGIFFAIFMTSIPALIKTLFNIELSSKFYDTAKKDFGVMRSGLAKWWEKIKK